MDRSDQANEPSQPNRPMQIGGLKGKGMFGPPERSNKIGPSDKHLTVLRQERQNSGGTTARASGESKHKGGLDLKRSGPSDPNKEEVWIVRSNNGEVWTLGSNRGGIWMVKISKGEVLTARSEQGEV